jgi:hypothetical protein
VVICGTYSRRYGSLTDALQAAFDDSASYRLPATVHFDGGLWATVKAA